MSRDVEPVAEGLFRLSGSGPAAVHLVLAGEPTLVDAGAPGRGPAIERALRSFGVLPRRIVLTHGDPDHAGGLGHLRAAFDAEVFAGAAERPLIDRTGWPDLPMLRRLLMDGYFRRTAPPTIDRWLDGTERLDELQVTGTPGHTPGHLAFEWQGWLLAGDAFVSGPRFRESLGFFTMDRATARRSIEALAARNFTGASSGHGRPADQAAERFAELIRTWRR